MQAIALSLQESAGLSGVVHCGPSKCSEADVVNANLNEKKGHTRIQEDTGKRKRKKSVCFGLKIILPCIDLFPFFPFFVLSPCFLMICFLFLASSLLVGCKWLKMNWFWTSISLMVISAATVLCVCVCVERDTNGENLAYSFKNQLIGTI